MHLKATSNGDHSSRLSIFNYYIFLMDITSRFPRPQVPVTSNPFPDFILPSHPKPSLSAPPPTTQAENLAAAPPAPSVRLISRKRNGRRLRLKSAPTAEKMLKINQRRGRYKRSTNNSHKKFISVAHRLLLRLLSPRQKGQFEARFAALENSRSYFMIILAWAMGKLDAAALGEFEEGFKLVMQNRLDVYRQQMSGSCNRNFINFRCGEITDIEYALRAMQLYFQGHSEQAVDALYRRDRTALLKKQQYDKALEILQEIEAELREKQPSKKGPEKEIKKEVKIASKEKKMPLLQMEKTYPIFEHFYPIMFSYEGPNDHTDLPRPQNQNIDYMQAHFCRVLEGHSRAGSGEGGESPS